MTPDDSQVVVCITEIVIVLFCVQHTLTLPLISGVQQVCQIHDVVHVYYEITQGDTIKGDCDVHEICSIWFKI